MSADRDHGATTIHASKGGGGGAGKWLIGAIAAVAVVGGGYAAWKTLGPDQGQTNIAYNDDYADDQLRAGPLEQDQAALDEGIAEDDALGAPATAETAPPPAPTRRAAARPAPTPVVEETIGVTSVNVTPAAAGGGDDIIVTARRPIWARMPSRRELTALYPQRALDRGQEGEAQLACTVQQGGALDCDRVSETPGFGYPALRVARTLRHSPTLADGRSSVGSNVNLRVMFRIAEEQPRSRLASR